MDHRTGGVLGWAIMRQSQIAGLTIHLIGGTDGKGGGHGPLVMLLHGFGAPGDDLVSLAGAMDTPHGTRFLFPEGPLSLNLGFGDARAWWIIDMNKIAQDRAAGRLRDPRVEVPKGLAPAREQVRALLEEAERKLGADPARTVIGGFSQGAMLACDLVLRTRRPFAGMIMLSGTLLCRQEWEPLMPGRRGLPVFQSHGQHDDLLAHQFAEELRDGLTAAGLSVEWTSFRGGHEIPEPVMRRAGSYLHRVLSKT
jgi:phospholipase/carboxylesterase